jgi:hypothetical protein
LWLQTEIGLEHTYSTLVTISILVEHSIVHWNLLKIQIEDKVISQTWLKLVILNYYVLLYSNLVKIGVFLSKHITFLEANYVACFCFTSTNGLLG